MSTTDSVVLPSALPEQQQPQQEQQDLLALGTASAGDGGAPALQAINGGEISSGSTPVQSADLDQPGHPAAAEGQSLWTLSDQSVWLSSMQQDEPMEGGEGSADEDEEDEDDEDEEDEDEDDEYSEDESDDEIDESDEAYALD